MKFNFKLFILLSSVLLFACKKVEPSQSAEPSKDEVTDTKENTTYDFIVSFGSCNKQYEEQPLWNAMAKQNPDIFIWGGDNIYSDTQDMAVLKANYEIQLNNPDYKSFVDQIENNIYGTWDDHDYGKNDAGAEWAYKAESQQLFLDFMGVDSLDSRRIQKGVYNAQDIKIEDKTLKLIVLDTRYFRSPLQEDTNSQKRFKPWVNGKGTLLGKEQWDWFENELKSSAADFHIIVSSIQIWADEHGFETWGNFPHEVEKLKTMLNVYKPKNVLMLSGDRHISEFSGQQLENYNYPIFDFTSSGLTHAYSKFTSEPNEDRVGEVIATESFGVLKYNFEDNSVLMEMRNADGVLQDYALKFN